MKSDLPLNHVSWHGHLRCSLLLLLLAFLMAAAPTPVSAFESKAGSAGVYVEMGGREGPDAFCGEIGVFGYANDNLSLRAGLALIASESFDDLFTGVTAGARYSFDSPLTPFVGLGVFGGYSKETVDASNDGVDNNDNGWVDESGETDEVISDVMASIYPEVGVNLWAGDHVRLTVSGKYHITTEGEDYNFWLFNLGMAVSF